MRFLVLIALCLAVASATYTNRNRFNRLLRSLRQQHQQQLQDQDGYFGSQGMNMFDLDEQDQYDEDQEYEIQCQLNGQCPRYQRYGSLNLDDDDDETEYEQDLEDQLEGQYQGRYRDQDQYQGRFQDQDQDQDQDQGLFQGLGRRQGRQQQQQRRRQQQQRHQCQPRFQLLQALEQANTQLAAKLYKQAKQENDDKNTVVSPAALQLALAAIQRGARGQTKRQLQRITGAGLNKRQLRQAHTALQQSLQGQDPIQRQTGQTQRAKVKTTTTIVINQRNRAQQQFIQAVRSCLNVQVKKCNFQQQPQQCRRQINRHIAQKTNHKLQHIVPQDAITTNTKMVVVNTAQIKAQWGRQFRQQQTTRSGRFFPLGSRQPKHVQLLQSHGQFNYYEDEQLQVVGVPTQQQELTMYLIVPKNKDGLNQVEKSQIQDGQQLKQLLEQAEQQQEQVQVELPKFQIKHKIDAKQTLRKQGVTDVFDADEADMSAINGQQQQERQQQQQQLRRRRQQLYGRQDEEDQYEQYQDDEQRQQQLHVNRLIQQATIKVDEQGISSARSGRQGQGQQYRDQYQYQDQDQDQDQDEYDEDDEQQQQYLQQQWRREELLEEIFGQGQRRRQGQRQHRQRRSRRQQWTQFQDQDDEEGQYGPYGQEKRVRANRAFAFAIKHNPSNQIVMVGRVVDATQKPRNQQQQGRGQQDQQALNGVDQQ